jgi:hypothetical protein
LFDMESVNLFNFLSLQFHNFKIKSTLTKRWWEVFPRVLRLYVSRTWERAVQIASCGCLTLFCTSRPRDAEILYLDGERHNLDGIPSLDNFWTWLLIMRRGRRRRSKFMVINKYMNTSNYQSLLYFFKVTGSKLHEGSHP